MIACRDVGTVLGFQLLALSRQRSPVPWEILVCDNGSADDTVRLAQRWTGRIPLRIVDARRASSLAEARNLGVGAAKGRWIAFCEADTEIGDGWLAVLCAALAEHSVVVGRFATEGPRSHRPRGGLTSGQANRFRVPPLVVGLPGDGGGNLGMHRSVFLAAGGFDRSAAALGSTDLCWRLRNVGQAPVVVPDLVTHVWVRATAAESFALGCRQGRWYSELLQRRRSGMGRRRLTDGGRTAWPILEWPGNSGVVGDDVDLDAAPEPGLVPARSDRAGVPPAAWRLGWEIGRRAGAPAVRSRGRSAGAGTSARSPDDHSARRADVGRPPGTGLPVRVM